MPSAVCPLCRTRKPKRACPALGQTICPVCCATKRGVEIACPPDCVYLSSAQAHPAAVVQRRQERDVGFVLPLLRDLTDTQYQLLIVFQSVTLEYAAGAFPPLLDEDVAQAAAATAATIETARKGIIYEHAAASAPAQRLTGELNRVIAELIREHTSQQGRIERDAAVALRRLEQAARTAGTALAGDEAPVYLKLLGRILRGTERPAAAPASDPPAASGNLIVLP